MTTDSALVILQNKLSSSEVRQVLLALNHPGLLEQYEIQQQIQFTLNLLSKKAPVREIVARLRSRFGVSRSTAYERVECALSSQSRYGRKNLVYSGPMFIED